MLQTAHFKRCIPNRGEIRWNQTIPADFFRQGPNKIGLAAEKYRSRGGIVPCFVKFAPSGEILRKYFISASAVWRGGGLPRLRRGLKGREWDVSQHP